MTMELSQLLIALGGLLLGAILGALIGHFRGQAQLEKIRAHTEREAALQQQALEQQQQKLTLLERSEVEKSELLDRLRNQLGEAEKRLAQAEEQSRQQQRLQDKLAATEPRFPAAD